MFSNADQPQVPDLLEKLVVSMNMRTDTVIL